MICERKHQYRVYRGDVYSIDVMHVMRLHGIYDCEWRVGVISIINGSRLSPYPQVVHDTF